MTRRIPLAAALTATLVAGAAALAQPVQPSPQPPVTPLLPPGTSGGEAVKLTGTSGGEAVNLSVEVAISRYRGDERVSRLPYVLSFTSVSGRRTTQSSLSLSADLPMRSGSLSHLTVGTQIDGSARGVGGDRYEVTVAIDESSILGEGETSIDALRVPGRPVFVSFASRNTLVLRDGQSHRYTAAADRITGENVRVDVTLTVLDQESAP